MQAVILVAGKGTRMAKHYEGPKQLLPVNGKPVITYMLDQLPEAVTELILVVGGPHEQTIREFFKSGEYAGRPIKFVVQTEQLGLAHAFKTAKEHVTGKWLGLIGDDIVDPAGLKNLAEQELALLAYRVPNPESFGVLVVDEENNLISAVEKPKEFVSDLVWTGHMLMDQDFMDIEIEPSARGEYETPDVWTKLTKEKGRKIKVIEAGYWLPINDKDQLEAAERNLTERKLLD